MPNNLNPSQFTELPIKRLLKMHSVDAELMGSNESGHADYHPGGRFVKHVMRQKREDIDRDPEYYDRVRESMKADPHHPAVAVMKDPQGRSWVVGGHHRIALAMELGRKTLPVAPSANEAEHPGFNEREDQIYAAKMRHQGRWWNEEDL